MLGYSSKMVRRTSSRDDECAKTVALNGAAKLTGAANRFRSSLVKLLKAIGIKRFHGC